MAAELTLEDAKLLYTAVLEAQLAGDSASVQALSQLAQDPDKLHEVFAQADEQHGAKTLGYAYWTKELPNLQTKARGQPCKQGETAASDGCVPSSGAGAGPKKRGRKPKQESEYVDPEKQDPEFQAAAQRAFAEAARWREAEAAAEQLAPAAATQSTAAKQLASYLANGVALGSDVWVSSRVKDAKYRTPVEYIRAEGQDFEGSPLPEGVERGTPKECFKNATLLVMGDSSLRYCEGFAMPEGLLPVLHAWAVTPDGKVIDNTFEDPERCAYRGVVYDRDKYIKYIFKAKVYGLLGGLNKHAEKILAKGGL